MIEVVSVPERGAVLNLSDWKNGDKSSDEEIAVVSIDDLHFTGRKFGKFDVLRDGEAIYSFEAVQYPAAEVPKAEEITPQGEEILQLAASGA